VAARGKVHATYHAKVLDDKLALGSLARRRRACGLWRRISALSRPLTNDARASQRTLSVRLSRSHDTPAAACPWEQAGRACHRIRSTHGILGRSGPEMMILWPLRCGLFGSMSRSFESTFPPPRSRRHGAQSRSAAAPLSWGPMVPPAAAPSAAAAKRANRSIGENSKTVVANFGWIFFLSAKNFLCLGPAPFKKGAAAFYGT